MTDKELIEELLVDLKEKDETIYALQCVHQTVQTSTQINALKEGLSELISIVEIHSDATNNNFAWAELESAKEALNFK